MASLVASGCLARAKTGQFVDKQFGLGDVIERNRVAQGADKQIELAMPQSMQQIVIGAVQHADPNVRPQLRKVVDRSWENVATDQRQRPDRDAGGVILRLTDTGSARGFAN